jgi:Tfp pilus assembly protein PilX
MSLMIVLIALVLMSLAAIGLVRTVDTGTLVVGNLAFKQGATSAADSSAESAITWLQSNTGGTTLNDHNTGAGYYATSQTGLDVSGKSSDTTRVLVDWNDDSCAYAASGTFASCVTPTTENTSNGYSTSYLITRMCKTTGDPNATGNGCAKPVSSTSGESPKKGELKYGEEKRFAAPAGPYYRIVVRSRGPRNSVSYTETYVHF